MHALMNSLIAPAQTISNTLPTEISPQAKKRQEKISIQIDESYWEPVEYASDNAETPCQLYASVSINGCSMHFEAYLVDEDGDICDHRHQKAIDNVKAALHDDEQWDTIVYQNNQYVVMAIPFGKSS